MEPSSASSPSPFRYRAGDGVLFTSAKAPPGAGLSQTCELPWGFLWSPLAPSDGDGAYNPEDERSFSNPSVEPPSAAATRRASIDGRTVLPESVNLPPVLCLTCLCYLNLFAELVDDSQWICPLCGASNVLPPSSEETWNIVQAVTTSPVVEYRQSIPQAAPTNSPLGDDGNTTTIVLVMDANLPKADAQAVGSVMQSILSEMAASPHGKTSAIQLGLVVFGRSVSVYQLGGAYGMACADVLSIRSPTNEISNLLTDEQLKSRPYLTTIPVPASGQASADLECLWLCLSAVYGVVLQDTDEEEENNDFNAQHGPPKSRLEMLKRRKEARLRKERLAAAAARRRTSAQQTGNGRSSSNAPSFSMVDASDNQTEVKSPWTALRDQTAASHPLRCTGEAIQVALDLCASATADGMATPSRTSRILLFTNGCPNHGDGSVVLPSSEEAEMPVDATSHHKRVADRVDPSMLTRSVQYFDLLARAASEVGIGVDVLCTGAGELALPAYQALVEPSSGYVLPHESFSTPHLSHNARFLLKHTFMSMVETDEDEEVPLEMDGCIVDLRMSSFLTPTQLVGPGELFEGPNGLLANERAAFAIGSGLAAKQGMATHNLPSADMLETTLTRARMGRFDPLSTFSVMLKLNDFFQRDKFAFFQCTVRFVQADGRTLVTRVFTHRPSIAKTVGEFLDAVDEEVVPVVLGKEAVYRSMFGREAVSEDAALDAPDAARLEVLAIQAQQDIDATVQRISGAFRLFGLESGSRSLDLTEEGGVKAAGSSVDFAFPPELADALRRLYHLRRGPMLAEGPMQSVDDRAQLRALFLRLPLEDCLCMMAPSVWSSGVLGPSTLAEAPFESVPPETLVLWQNAIIGGDYYHNLFLWSGRSVSGEEYDGHRKRMKQFLLQKSEKRFPMPVLHVLTEGDSMSRRFTALLAPSHADPVDHQLSNFPELTQLTPEELTALRSKFRFYDPSSDASFRSWFWETSSATSISKEEGVSLCE